MTNRRKTTQIALASRPYVIITSLVAALAAGAGGCASSLERDGHTSGFGTGLRATVEIPPSATKGRFDAAYYAQQVGEFGAPSEWAEHAGTMTTAIEAQRALAEATRIRASADHAASLAEANQLLTEAISTFEAQSAASRRLSETAHANFEAGSKQREARQVAFEAEQQAALFEAQAQFDAAILRAQAMREKAERQYELALADHKRLLAETEAYASHTRTTIEQMRASSGTVLGHARIEADELEALALARLATAAAQWKSLDDQASSTRHWAESRHAELLREASAIRDQANARVESLTAEADAIAEWELDEKLAAAVASMQAKYDNAAAQVEMLRQDAAGELAAAASALTTERLNLQAQIEKDGQAYEAELARIAADTRIAASRASIDRAHARELFHDARAQFLRMTAKAMGGDTRADKARHFEQAQVWADSIAKNGNASLLAGAPNLDTPEMRSAIEAFVTQMAQAKELERSVEAMLERSQQDTVMRRSGIEVWWSEARAATEAALERIPHAEMETVERMRQQLADAEEIEARAVIEFEQSQRSVEAARLQAQERLEDLHRQARFAASESQNQADEILAEAESVKAQGLEQAERMTRQSQALRAQADAEAQALRAQAEQILADAQATASSFAIMARQAEESLVPELDRRAADAARLMAEAQIERDQALQVADTTVSVAQARHSEALAALEFAAQSFETDQEEQLARASATHDASISKAQQVLSEATASYAAFQADDAARRARAQAVESALLAFVDERHAVADAQDAAVFAEFSARLATFAADYDRSYADAYFKDFLAEANLTTADMKRYVQAAQAALGRLEQASTARQPVMNAEAETVTGDQVEAMGTVEVLEVESMSANGVASVPTIDDE